MAYKNLVLEAVATRAEVFKRFRDWMCKRNGSYDYSVTGLGWTLHDAVYAVDENTLTAGDYFVMYSPGESGKEDLYFQVIYSATANMINVKMCLYWNATTHAAVSSSPTASNWQVLESSSGTLSIYGDLDTVYVYTSFGTSNYGCAFGMVNDPFYDISVAVSSLSVSSGASRTVTMDVVPGSWKVGTKIVVRDTANIEFVEISAISGLDVTFVNFVASYLAGCKFAHNYPVVCPSTTNFFGTYYQVIALNGTKNGTTNAITSQDVPTNYGAASSLDGSICMAQHEIGSSFGFLGRFKNILNVHYSAAHLSVYVTETGENYRAVTVIYSGIYMILKEV